MSIFTVNMKPLILSGIIAALAAPSFAASLPKDFYANRSVLAQDNWVKVGVDKTGVYEISYETLRNMGFQNPEKVSVYGRGGRVLPESFITNTGLPNLVDDLSPVNIVHENDRIYFYALGPEEITFETNSGYDLGGFFNRKSNNIYSKRGYYFLTDSKPVQEMPNQTHVPTSSSSQINSGVSYIYHETDSVQNYTASGQLFWGEKIGLPGLNKKSWNVTMPGAKAGKGVMQCVMYIADNDSYSDGSYNYGFTGADLISSTPYKPTKALYLTPYEPTVSQVSIPGETGNVFVEFTPRPQYIPDYSNLDFWVVSYETELSSFSTRNSSHPQQVMAFPGIAKNTIGKLEIPGSSSLMVFDVTTPASPQRLAFSSTSEGTGILGVKNTSKIPVVVIFDKNVPQYQISGYESAYTKITNQNLHALQGEGADFIIITIPSLRDYAEEIAELHRKYDDIKVVVATTEECYNEFSGGVPDPMAYRSFAKMLYNSERKPKNILLMGPLYADFRGLQTEHNPIEGIIAYQSPSVSISRGAHNINDFYGIMADKFNYDFYERNEVNLGVGILPIRFESEAKIVVEKIKNYLQRDDHAYYLNRYTAVSGEGDQHTHDLQVRDINNVIRGLDNTGTIFTPLAIDTYGKAEAQKKFFNQIHSGSSLFSYFGHGSEMFLSHDREFFNAGDVYKLHNTVLPFGLFGGCTITNTDRGLRGLGETIVTDTPNGCLGAVVSTRETWSGQNYEFFKQFFICLYTNGQYSTSQHRDNPVTIGEVYASVKNYSTYSNELSYQLISDPALHIPIINRTVEIKSGNESGEEATLYPGEKLKISGTINYPDGREDNNFNGQLVLRLNEPEKVIPMGKIETGEDTKTYAYTYRDEQISMTTAEVKNGKFDVEIHVPANVSTFANSDQRAILYFSAYDANTKVGAGKGFTMPVAIKETPSEESLDLIPPVISMLEFVENDCAVDFSASDNCALNLSNNPLAKGIYLYIDGKEYTAAHFVEPMLENGGLSMSKYVQLDNLAYGEHSARLKVKDLAGNHSEAEITFTYQPYSAKYTLVRSEQSGPEATRIELDGPLPSAAKVIVMSASGTEIWNGELNGSNFIEWNHTDNAGNPVPAGHYKAYLLETGTTTLKGHSLPIDIPVI